MQFDLIDGVVEVHSKNFLDSRGLFLNAYRRYESVFQHSWAHRSIVQVNISRTSVVGVIRGLHLQAEPHHEAKLVRCLHGRVWDVAVDLRPASSTYGRWHAVELSAAAANALLIPEGCAHGFQVLEANSELLYLHSGPWVPDAETGVRWNDPTLAIEWPLPVADISARDAALPFLHGSAPLR